MTYAQWNPQPLKLLVCYMSLRLILPPCRNYWCRSINKKYIRPVLCCGRDTWHIESKQISQPPYYLIIIVNRISYSNNKITKNKSRMPLDLYIKLGPYKFFLQASVDHHGYAMNSGHYTASINCCGKTFHCNDNKITDVISRILIIHLLPIYFFYKLMVC